MTNEELLSVAEIVEKLTDRFNAQAALHRERFDEHVKLIASMKADHEAKMVEHRAAFGARTEADAKIIAGLRSEIGAARMAVLERDSLISERAKLQSIINEQSASAKEAGEKLGWTGNESAIQAVERVVKERDGLLTQVQDMRAEMERLKLACSTYAADWDTAGKACRMRVDEYPLSAVIRLVRDDAERAEVAKRLVAERDALRAEVAALQERLRASIARGDFAQMEVAALKSQTPKQHPVKVGEWVKRLTPSPMTPAGGVAKVTDVFEVHGLAVKIERPDGIKGTWWAKCCEPCDPPAADHDTDAGKASAESAVRTEPVPEETWLADVGSVGTVVTT